MDAFDKMAQTMIEKTITNDQFIKMIELAYPLPEEDKKGAVSKWQTKVDLLESIYAGPYNNTIAGTAWGALNALTERMDWHRTARKGSNEAILAGASGFDPMVNAEKNRLLGVVRQVVGV
jgi:Domain of unknown function (DUF932).